MHDQPFTQRLILQQQQGGGGSKGGESSKDRKKREKREKEQEKREEELFALQQQQIQQAQQDAERARKEQEAANAKIKNRESYESLLSRSWQGERSDYFRPFDPNTDYTKKSTQQREIGYARGAFSKAESKRKAAETKIAQAEKKQEARDAEQAKQLEILRKVPPVPTEYNLDAQAASFEARGNEKRRRGLGATILAGETGGYDTEKRTLLG